MEKKIVVFASGEGTNFQAIIDAVRYGSIRAKIEALITDRPLCGAINRAKTSGIPVLVVRKKGVSEERFCEELLRILEQISPDLIVLAGYLKIIPQRVVESFRYRIINLHPSLLPCFGGAGMFGMRVHEAVIGSGARFSGCTVHFVDNSVDGGPIIGQSVVGVDDSDTPESLSEKIHPKEHELLVKCVNLVLSGQFTVVGKRVIWKSGKEVSPH
ncbi:MAG TPA: phosphoribosylglycinamide formyltransferase [Thermoplasmataceae archaeon]|nr:phosphoribosylglycinamide formyltransferase [Thermoplasmataceae archaeon]